MSRVNVLWAIDHVCYDGNLHGGGRLFWNVLPLFDSERFHIVPCMLRASDEIRGLFRNSPVPVEILDKGKFDPTTVVTFLRMIRKHKIQVMHLHCYACSSFGRLAGWLTGVPCIIHDYDTEVYFPYPGYLGIVDRLLAPSTALGLAASPMCKEFMIGRRRLTEERVQMLFHAVPQQKYETVPPDRVARVRRDLAIPERGNLVCTVTKLGPQRGNELLLDAAVQVLRELPETRFLLVYKPTHFHRQPDRKYVPVDHAGTVKDLHAYVERLGIREAVHLIEEPDNVDELIAASDLFVAPFESARFSSVHILEAMAKGKPVVATDLGEQREIIRDGVNGYLVPPSDRQALAARLQQLLKNDGELMRLAERARRDAVELYSTEAYVNTLQDVYHRLAGGRAVEVAGRGAA